MLIFRACPEWRYLKSGLGFFLVFLMGGFFWGDELWIFRYCEKFVSSWEIIWGERHRRVIKWCAGYDVVAAVRSSRMTDSNRLTAEAIFCLIEKIGNVQASRHAAGFCLLLYPALDALNSMNEESLNLRGLVVWIGFPSTSVFYKRPERRQAGATKFPLI